MLLTFLPDFCSLAPSILSSQAKKMSILGIPFPFSFWIDFLFLFFCQSQMKKKHIYNEMIIWLYAFYFALISVGFYYSSLKWWSKLARKEKHFWMTYYVSLSCLFLAFFQMSIVWKVAETSRKKLYFNNITFPCEWLATKMIEFLGSFKENT